MLAKKMNTPVDAETFRIDFDGTLLEIGGKPSTIEEIQGQYMGLLKISPQGWSEIERIRGDLPKHQQDNIHVTGILQKVIDGKKYVDYLSTLRWPLGRG